MHIKICTIIKLRETNKKALKAHQLYHIIYM
jgi:hypothetical protein